MQNTNVTRGEKFIEVIREIESLTSSQQKFIHEMLSHRRKVRIISRKRTLRKSFGLWADREDIKSSQDYVNQLRKRWEIRFED